VTEFSIVTPIKGTKEEQKIISKTLPFYYSVGPSEVILSVDDPPEDEGVISEIKSIIENHHAQEITRILKVKVGGEGWNDQQMKARYTGFLKAEYDRILQVDVDLIINKNVLKAVELVGKNNVGLASCSRLPLPKNFLNFYRLFARIAMHYLRESRFAGLYAVWKPFWLEVEPKEVAKKYTKIKAKVRDGKPVTIADFYAPGDDTHLNDLMAKKYRCVYLKDIGGLVLADEWENRPFIQYCKGVYFASLGRRMLPTLAKTIIRAHPYYFCGYLHGRGVKGDSQFSFSWHHKAEGGANA